MEETREKIELFRHYYFVCFRSFDQDQYSPTYLEPLNMYIIVFREGTLSVRSLIRHSRFLDFELCLKSSTSVLLLTPRMSGGVSSNLKTTFR